MLADDRFLYGTPGRILFGNGARKDLPALMHKLGMRRGLLVTDRFFAQSTSLVSELTGLLKEAGIEETVFDGGEADPTVQLCIEARAFAEARGDLQAIDHIVALGGGSNIDLAKVLAITVRFGGRPEDYVGEGKIPGKPLPLIAITTTSGTGSEITGGAILVNPAADTKVGVLDNDLRPTIAVIDPEITLTCPPRLTGDAGMDALTHAIESFLTIDTSAFQREGQVDPVYTGRNHLTRLMAREAIRLGFANLPACYAGGDLEARTGMAYSSLLAALSYASAGLNAVHALAYGLADLTHKTHGSTNAVFLPYVMDALRDVREDELAEIGRLAGEPPAPPAELAKAACRRTRDLIAAVGIPVNLKAFGISEAQLPTLVQKGISVTRLTKSFPLQPPQPAYARIVDNAFHGSFDFERRTAASAAE